MGAVRRQLQKLSDEQPFTLTVGIAGDGELLVADIGDAPGVHELAIAAPLCRLAREEHQSDLEAWRVGVRVDDRGSLGFEQREPVAFSDLMSLPQATPHRRYLRMTFLQIRNSWAIAAEQSSDRSQQARAQASVGLLDVEWQRAFPDEPLAALPQDTVTFDRGGDRWLRRSLERVGKILVRSAFVEQFAANVTSPEGLARPAAPWGPGLVVRSPTAGVVEVDVDLPTFLGDGPAAGLTRTPLELVFYDSLSQQAIAAAAFRETGSVRHAQVSANIRTLRSSNVMVGLVDLSNAAS